MAQAAWHPDLPADARARRTDRHPCRESGPLQRFLAAGLVVGVLAAEPIGFAFKLFFLGCAVAAGLFGAATVQRGILFVQALPAALALAAVLIVGG
jgi:putative membrane protein